MNTFLKVLDSLVNAARFRPYNVLMLIVTLGIFFLIVGKPAILDSKTSTAGLVLISLVVSMVLLSWIMQYLQQNHQVRRENAKRDRSNVLDEDISTPSASINFFARSSITRLSDEIEALSKRANINLALGCVTSLMGIGFLGYFIASSRSDSSSSAQSQTNATPSTIETRGLVQSTNKHDVVTNFTSILSVLNTNSPGLLGAESKSQKDPTMFLLTFIPRVTFVILIELFAFFFLNLYKAILAELKYYQNEITNLEMKFLSMHLAIGPDQTPLLADVVKRVMETERNFILQKDQTTVELEKARMTTTLQTDFIKSAVEALKSK